MKFGRALFFAGVVASAGAGGASTQADDLSHKLGTLRSNTPLITTINDKKIIAFFVSEKNRCVTQAVVWDKNDESAASATGVRLLLKAEGSMNVAGTWGSLVLKCGKNAATMDVTETRTYVLSAR